MRIDCMLGHTSMHVNGITRASQALTSVNYFNPAFSW